MRTCNLSKNCRTLSSSSKGAAADVHGRRSSHWDGMGGWERTRFNFMPSSSFFRSNHQKLPTHYVVLAIFQIRITEFLRRKQILINRIIFGISWTTTSLGSFLILGCVDIHISGKLQITYFKLMFLICEIWADHNCSGNCSLKQHER